MSANAAAAAAAAAANAEGPPDLDNFDDDELDEMPEEYHLPAQETVLVFYLKPPVQIFIALLIVGNFVVSAISKQLPQPLTDSQEGVFFGFEVFFNVMFSLELLINMYGNYFWFFWTGPNRWWNLFDFLIVIISLMAMLMESLPGISVLRLFRAFRVFRLFKRVESLRLIIEGIIASLPGVMNAFVVLFIFMGIWAIMGVEFFRFRDDVRFGNFMKALYTMFEMLTGDSWNSVTTTNLVYNEGFSMAAFWSITFLFITSIVLMSVVVAILLEKYLNCVQNQLRKKELRRQKELRRKQNLTGMPSPNMAEQSAKAAMKLAAEKGEGTEAVKKMELPNQDKIKALVSSNSVQLFVAALILLNFMTGAVNAFLLPEDCMDGLWTCQDPGYGDLFDFFYALEVFFCVAFSVELALNMYGYFFWEFWTGPNASWNQFDFVIVMVSILSLAMENVPGISVLRLFRAFRVMRLFKRIESLRMIIEAVLMCMPKVAQAFVVLAILMGVWCIMGVEFFWERSPQKFGTFVKAFLTMWQVLSGDAWSTDKGLARDLIFGCQSDDISLCANPSLSLSTAQQGLPLSAIYFISYYFVASIVMNNVIIAILLEGYLKCTSEAAEKKEKERKQKEKDEKKRLIEEGDDKTMAEMESEEDTKLRGLSLGLISQAINSEAAREYLSIGIVGKLIEIISQEHEMKELMQSIIEKNPSLKEIFAEDQASGSVLLSILTVNGDEEDASPATQKRERSKSVSGRSRSRDGREVPKSEGGIHEDVL